MQIVPERRIGECLGKLVVESGLTGLAVVV